MKVVSLIASLLSLTTAALSMENPRDNLEARRDLKEVLQFEKPELSETEFDRLWTDHQGDTVTIWASLFPAVELNTEYQSPLQYSEEENVRAQLKTTEQEQLHQHLQEMCQAKTAAESLEKEQQELQANIANQAFEALNRGKFNSFKKCLRNLSSFDWSWGDNKETFLHLAAKNGQAEVIKLLLGNKKFGIDVNGKLANQQTALHLAINGGHVVAVEKLLHFNADVLATTDGGCTVLEMALHYLEGRIEANDKGGIADGLYIINLLKSNISYRVEAGDEGDAPAISFLYNYVNDYKGKVMQKSTDSVHKTAYKKLIETLERMRIYLQMHKEKIENKNNYQEYESYHYDEEQNYY